MYLIGSIVVMLKLRLIKCKPAFCFSVTRKYLKLQHRLIFLHKTLIVEWEKRLHFKVFKM